MFIAEVKKEGRWRLTFPMEKNKNWINPDESEYAKEYGLESENAEYEPVNEFPSRDSSFFRMIGEQLHAYRGLPDDLSPELKDYYDTYWHDEEGSTWGHGWFTYRELMEFSHYRFVSLEALPDKENIRLVYWFY